MRLNCYKIIRILEVLAIVSLLITTGCGAGKKNCPAGQYKAKPVGDCNNSGICTDKPEACQYIWAPVCGCDGNTYGNECEAAAAGVNVASEGKCTVTCNSNADIADPANYCKKQDGDCDGIGSPAAKPNACPDVWDPVCGCDGNTYGNTCEAAANGINIVSEDACP